MATKTLEIAIVGTDKGATKVFRDVDEAAGTTEGKLRKLGRTIGPEVAAAAAAVVAGVGVALKAAWSAADESARIGRETERVIRTMGAAAWTSADQIGDLAAAISDKSGADDEMIQSGANLLLTFAQIKNRVGENNDVFNRATALALDMSVVLGTDMSAASIQLGKALNDPIRGITALRRAGVSFTEEQQDQIRTLVKSGQVLEAQKIILEELGRQFGGAAEAANTPVDRLRVKFENLSESVGTMLVPVVSKAASFLGVVTDALIALPAPIRNVVVGIGAVGTGVAGAITVIAKLADVFGDSLKPIMDFTRRQFDNTALAVGNLATRMGASQDAGAKLASSLSAAVVPGLGAVMAAATLAFGVWAIYQQTQADNARRTKEFTGTLDENTGALTDNTRAHIEKTLTDRNQIDNLNKARVSLEQYSDAIATDSRLVNLNLREREALSRTLPQEATFRAKIIDKLVSEGGARNDLLVTLAQQGALDMGLIDSIYEQSRAYDEQQRVIANKVKQQAIANGKTEEEAELAARAASANTRHAETIKEVADELRAQTDPYFAAFRSQQALTEALATYDSVNRDARKTDQEKQAAYIAAAQAASAYRGDLLTLNAASRENGATADALQENLRDLAKFGLNQTDAAAIGAVNALSHLGATADEVGRTHVNIPVDADTSNATAKLRDLAAKIVGMAYSSTDFFGPSLGNVVAAAFRRVGLYAEGGNVRDGMFIVGEQGPELGVKSGNQVRIFSNPDTQRMVGMGGDVNVYVNQSDANPYEIGRELVWALRVTR
jgi:hypothetical protein